MDSVHLGAYFSRMPSSFSNPAAARRGSSRRRVAVVCVAVLAGAFAYVYYDAVASGKVLYASSSPDGKYKIEIVQTRDFSLYERRVYLTARSNGKKILDRKLLYTGDFLDEDFRDL